VATGQPEYLYTNWGRAAAYRDELLGQYQQFPMLHGLHGSQSTIKFYNCLFALALLEPSNRLVTTEDFIATNGATPFTTIGGFSPWRSLAKN
jgi:hypothetical protein